MPRIASVATAVPPHRITQADAAAFAALHFRSHRKDIDRLMPVFEHAGIETRYTCVPPAWFAAPKTFGEKNDLYIEWCTRLGETVARDCMARAGLTPDAISHIIFVSTTGLATPSIDSRLMNVLSLGPHVVRTPLWGLGCAGGAAGLSHAYRAACVRPDACVLLVAVELCSLTFHFGDFSKSNVVATALFADGAAGVLVAGDALEFENHGRSCPVILGTQSTTWPDSLDVMGWNFDSVGMQVVFSRSIPGIVKAKVRTNIDEFLSAHDLTFDHIQHMVTHPGGMKVIEAYEEALGLPAERMTHARTVLRDYGNMSSPTVLFVLNRLLASDGRRTGNHAIVTALGPGFSAENILLQF